MASLPLLLWTGGGCVTLDQGGAAGQLRKKSVAYKGSSTGKCLSRLLCQVTEYFLSCRFDRFCRHTELEFTTLVHLCLPTSHF